MGFFFSLRGPNTIWISSPASAQKNKPAKALLHPPNSGHGLATSSVSDARPYQRAIASEGNSRRHFAACRVGTHPQGHSSAPSSPKTGGSAFFLAGGSFFAGKEPYTQASSQEAAQRRAVRVPQKGAGLLQSKIPSRNTVYLQLWVFYPPSCCGLFSPARWEKGFSLRAFGC